MTPDTRVHRVTLLAAAVLGAGCAGAHGGGGAGSPAVARLAGCYALTLGRWTRGGIGFGGGAPVELPVHIRLVGEPDAAVERGRLPVRPALATSDVRSDFPPSWALDRGRNAAVVWSSRAGEYRLLLAPTAGDTLRGAASFTPVGLAGQYPRSASVVAVREGCAEGL